jgi:hypothetical protein
MLPNNGHVTIVLSAKMNLADIRGWAIRRTCNTHTSSSPSHGEIYQKNVRTCSHLFAPVRSLFWVQKIYQRIFFGNTRPKGLVFPGARREPANMHSHPRNREGKNRLEIGITHKYSPIGTNRDVYNEQFFF